MGTKYSVLEGSLFKSPVSILSLSLSLSQNRLDLENNGNKVLLGRFDSMCTLYNQIDSKTIVLIT